MRLKLLTIAISLCLANAASAGTNFTPPPKKIHIVKTSKTRIVQPFKYTDADDDEIEVCVDDDYIVNTHQNLRIKKNPVIDISKKVSERLALFRLLALTKIAYPNIT